MSGRSRAAALATAVGLVAVALVVAASVGNTLRHLAAGPTPADTRTAVGVPRPPNLILIVTDDQRWDTLGVMPSVRSLLATHGVTFTNAFATTPVCCPSRASILTGRYARHTGVLDNVGPFGGASALDDRSTLATWLDDAGYQTALVGKYLNEYPRLGAGYVPPGWDEWHAIARNPAEHYYGVTLNENGRLVRYPDGPAGYQTTVLFDRAEEFVRRAEDPFFLYLAPSAPHLPAVAAPEDVGAFQDLPPWRPASYDEPDRGDKPWHGVIAPLTEEIRRWIDEGRRHMLESLRSLDREIAGLVRTLDEEGRLESTLIAFTSDNGFLWGEHGLVSKTWAYEESIRVPLVVRVPWMTAGRVDDRLVLNIDLAPTLAELAGSTPVPPPDGRSLLPLLDEAPAARWRVAFVVEWLGRDLSSTGRGPTPYRGLRTTRHLYLEYANGWRELYDLRQDPLQLENLAGDPGYARGQARLAARLALLGGDSSRPYI